MALALRISTTVPHISIFLSLIMPVLPKPVLAVSCDSAKTHAADNTATHPAGTDGLIHITYGFWDEDGNTITPNPNVAAAVKTAVAQWNSFSGTTGVKFDPAPVTIGQLQI